jgi:signal transduction histidine kinase
MVSADDLRTVVGFADLPPEQIDWFLAHAEERRILRGEYLARAGDPASHMMVILEGGFQVRPEGEGADTVVINLERRRVSGALPFSRMKVFPMGVRASADSHILLLDREHFPAMYQAMPDLIPHLVGVLTDRVRDTARHLTQSEKLAALGKLSAGLAHELNNPAAAARQAATAARQLFHCYQELLDRFATASISPAELEVIRQLEQRSIEQLTGAEVLDSLARSDREEEIGAWLSELGSEQAWQHAPALADAGWTQASLAASLNTLSPSLIPLAAGRLASAIEMAQSLSQIQTSTTRMSDLVAAMKDYSFMDRASIVEFDLNQNIETTLKLFSFRLKKGTQLETVYDLSLPKICASGGQLNQVWTNLIDNALDAIESYAGRQDKGRLRVETRREIDHALILFTDNGGGIPPGVADRIFDPFFTTKPQGDGTGLGLDMVYRIVKQHHGDIRFESQPGATTFFIRLPFDQPRSELSAAAELAQAS